MNGRFYLGVFKIIFFCFFETYVSVANHVHQAHTSPVTLVSGYPTTSDAENRILLLRRNLLDCTEESKVNPDIILKLRSGQRKFKIVKTEPPELKNWALCLLVKSNIMSSEGVLKQDVVLSSIPENDRNKVEMVIDKCLYKKPHSPQDTAWQYIKCFHNRYPKYAII